ncbi:methionyl-tRNA formyltransferase [Candidatus Pandoraea novymonadis]|uniref:Methionyl-tRNA formyltransferase n=1 Tax=Candidatus Pandoraea novymonadis TaxID=1808959 RepID=A0ABX5FHN5_9BURK|nr:methionyl-tRNA formyltransferase [Candidatus Pandoraea novymonadis]PSB92437.1 Methionyl-tRNA formyltransferase [Candidatus Pandoraea novymonadis]
MTLSVAFAGTPEFAEIALSAINRAGFSVVYVLTQPDRPAGRGMRLQVSSVKRYAESHGMLVAQPRSLRCDGKYSVEATAVLGQLRALAPDIMVVAAYGLLLPQVVLDLPRYGCLNIHGSLLSRWRGAAPIQRAIEAGDLQTGITIMQMDAGLDTGAIISSGIEEIYDDDTTATLHKRLANLGGRMVVEALQKLANNGYLPATPQSTDGVMYAPKLTRAEAMLDWSRSSDVLARQIRAFDPFPVAFSILRGVPLKLWRATSVVFEGRALPGTVVAVNDDSMTIACGDGALCVTECQKPGGKRLPARSFFTGFSVKIGDVFGAC